jgi:CheY-like chemotaxis protein
MPHILIVDDDRQMGDLTRLIFKSLGYEVVQVLDGKDILDVLDSVDPALVLMDIYLPSGMDGWEVTELIRNSDHYQSLPVIAFTAAGTVVDDHKTAEAGFDGLLRKPFSSGEMRNYVARFLDALV